MNIRTTSITLVLALTIAAGAWAQPADPAGREAAANQDTQTLSGTLSRDDCMWMLNTSTTDYRIMLGRSGRNSEVELSEGQDAEIYGFVLSDAIAPITLQTGGSEHQLWNEDGTPAWARAKDAGQQTRSGRGRMTSPESMQRQQSIQRQQGGR